MVKLIVMDSQNVKKLGSGKASLKRSFSVGVNRTNNKGETAMKPVRQRRKPGDSPPPFPNFWNVLLEVELIISLLLLYLLIVSCLMIFQSRDSRTKEFL